MSISNSTPRSHLFEPLQLGPLKIDNRIVIAPMCQYSATEGTPGDWHLIHLGHLALSGAGLLIIEATAVEADGRISPGDLGLYSDANEEGLARVLHATRAHSPTHTTSRATKPKRSTRRTRTPARRAGAN